MIWLSHDSLEARAILVHYLLFFPTLKTAELYTYSFRISDAMGDLNSRRIQRPAK